MNINNIGNEYVVALGRETFENTPKAVFAALAYSLAMRLCDDNDDNARKLLSDEWAALNVAGLVKQKPYKNFILKGATDGKA